MSRTIERANEEYEEFRSFDIADRFWIAFVLNAAKVIEDHKAFHDLMHAYPRNTIPVPYEPFTLSEFGRRAYLCQKAFKTHQNDPLFNFGANAVGPMVEIGTCARRFDRLKTPETFRFFMERLFGGKARPYTRAAFAACSMSPECGERFDLIDLLPMAGHGPYDWTDETDCLYFPTLQDWQR